MKKIDININKVIIFSFIFFLLLSQNVFAVEEKVLEGVSFLGKSLGGLNREEVEDILDREDTKIEKQRVILRIKEKNQEYEISYKDLGIQLDKDKIWQEAISLGEGQGWLDSTWRKWVVHWQGYILPVYLKYDKDIMQKKLNELTSGWRIKERDARFSINKNEQITIIPEKIGLSYDIDIFNQELEQALKNKPGQMLEFDLSLREIYPEMSQEKLEALNIKYVISEFTTTFNNTLVNRTSNIHTAVKALQCYLVAPGEVFSFNDAVGPRTADTGYKEAKIIVANDFVYGIGGGVCQVSTTLYNTVVRAGLEIVERSSHSLVIPYVKPGFDAAVSYGYKDLKFRNNSDSYILINANVGESTLTFEIYSSIKNEHRIEMKSVMERRIEPKTRYEIDPEVALNQYVIKRNGSPGYVYRVEKYIYDHEDNLLHKEIISHDYYAPLEKVILVNPESPLLSNSSNV